MSLVLTLSVLNSDTLLSIFSDKNVYTFAYLLKSDTFSNFRKKKFRTSMKVLNFYVFLVNCDKVLYFPLAPLGEHR